MRRAYFRLFAITGLCGAILLSGGLAHSALASTVANNGDYTHQTGPYATAKGAVNVRGGPGTGFYITGTLYANEVVPILAVSPDGGWWYISTNFGEGWISNVAVTAFNTAGVGVRDPGLIGTVISGIANVRGGAGPNAIQLGQITRGQQVYVLGRNADGTWLEIQWAYGTGWVSAELMSTNGTPAVTAVETVPVTADAPYALVTATYLNVRTGPGINYAVLGQVYGGNTLTIVGRTNDNTWYQVETVYGTGWVYASYVIPRNEYGTAPVTTDSATGAEVAGPIGIINTGALNIRSGPGAQYTTLGTLAGGTETRIIGRSADWSWWLLETPLGTGWANSVYILVRGDTASVPYVAPGESASPATDGQGGQAAPPPAITGPSAFVATGALNIRSGPNSTFPALGAVYAGTRMPIIGQSPDRGWWLVESPFGNGWISKAFVIPEGNTTGVPVVQ
jgi:uncharacterized protein YgiM (DUF1202 family)